MQARPFCYRCRKPASTCYCQEVRPVRPGFEVVLLQHPRERRKGIGTARMVHLSIPGSRLIVGERFEENPEVASLLADAGRHCVVLFPGPGSLDLDAAGSAAFPADRRLVVFVIDGTWACARKILRLSPSLAALPKIRFSPRQPSEYSAIRQQPAPQCLSTLEAVHHLIGVLEPATDASPMLGIFREMVRRQETYA
jgi:DTW domain-containing protein